MLLMIKKEGCISFKKVAYNVLHIRAVGDLEHDSLNLPLHFIRFRMFD